MDTTNKITGRLNPEQKQVAEHTYGPMLVAAVAGAGKTSSIIARIAMLVALKIVEPQRILAVTFSKKGADEMNERLEAILPDSGARIGTFHSLGYEILRSEKPEIKGYTVDDRNRYRFVIKDAIGYRELNWAKADLSFIEGYIGWCKAMMVRPWHEQAKTIAFDFARKHPGPHSTPSMLVATYERAEELRHERQILTFDDMLFDSVELLRDNEAVRERWASRWSFVIQDEAQDQSLAQLLIGELLSQDHRNYMLVGDVSQTIYSWRGAQPKTVIDFPAKWNAEVVMMGRNYRCGHSIVNAANKVLDAMDPNTKLPMSMICERGTESQIHVNEYANLDEEGEAISAQIVEEVAGGREYKDAYVLFRTNAQSRGIEEAMISNRIPYRILGATNFYERKEVRDLVAYLRLAEGRGDMEDIARCINSPFRFLGKAFVEKVQAVYRPNENTPVEAVRAACRAARVNSKQQVSAESWARLIETAGARIARGASAAEGSEDRTQALPSKILEDIFRDTGYGAWLIRDEGQETTENNRVSNCREMIRAAGRFTTAAELLDYIEKTVGRAKAERKTDGNTNKVTMMSLHRSKGLEAPVVFISGVNAGILPHRRAEDEEEERRLFYVGVTRAKDSLRLSYVRTITVGERVIPTEPSPFLFEAGLMVSPAEETVAC